MESRNLFMFVFFFIFVVVAAEETMDGECYVPQKEPCSTGDDCLARCSAQGYPRGICFTTSTTNLCVCECS
ncbi:hypothetical protein ACP275_14G085200 [Erythranthe tilingii]